MNKKQKVLSPLEGKKNIFWVLAKTFFPATQPPLLCHQSPKGETGLKGDDAGTKLSQTGGATAAGAKAGIVGALEKRYCSLI